MDMLQFSSKSGNLWIQSAISGLRLLSSTVSLLLLLTLFASFQTLAAITPSPVAVDSQVKVTFSELEYEHHSKIAEVKAKLTNRSAEPILTPIRLVIRNIKPRTVT
jgi:hypothetical protein